MIRLIRPQPLIPAPGMRGFSTQKIPEVVKGTIWLNNVYPIFIRNRFLRRIYRTLQETRNIEEAVVNTVVPKELPGGSKIIDYKIESNKKEGGLYYHFTLHNVVKQPETISVDPPGKVVEVNGDVINVVTDALPGSSMGTEANVDAKKPISETKANAQDTPITSPEDLARVITENSLKAAYFRGIRAYGVRGQPWVEDLTSRPPYRKLRVEFFGEDVPIEKLFKEFRPYGRLSDIVPLPSTSKEQPRYADVHFELARDAASAKNCTHGDVIDGTRLSIHYEKNQESNSYVKWVQDHPRLSIPLLIAIFAGVTYLVFDPIRRFYIINNITDRFSLEKYFKQFIKWLQIPTSIKGLISSGNFTGRRKEDTDAWIERKGDSEKLERWLRESPENFVLVTGARGSGSEKLVESAISGRPYSLSIDCNDLIDTGEDMMLSKLAAQVGFFPVFGFYNTIAGFADMAILSLTGMKAGLSTTTEGQVHRMLELTLHALAEVSEREQKLKAVAIPDDPSNPLAAALVVEAETNYPVVVIHGFMNKPKSKNAFVYDRLVEWAALLEENKIAHVVFVSENPSQSPKALQKALPAKTLELVALSDADYENSLSYVQRRLGLVFASAELQSAAKDLGGRLTDLEILVQKIKAGATPSSAINDIITRSIAEIRKVGFGDDAEEAAKIPWKPEQCWKVIQLLSKYDEVGIDEIKAHPLFGGDDHPLQQMEIFNLISITHQNGRPHSIHPARPIYRIAFQRMAADPKLSSALNIVQAQSYKKKIQKKLDAYETELQNLTKILSGNGATPDSRFIPSREGRRGLETRIDFLAKLIGVEAKKYEKYESEEEKHKAMLKLAE